MLGREEIYGRSFDGNELGEYANSDKWHFHWILCAAVSFLFG